MSTPLYDATLSDVLAHAREQVIAAERAAAERVARAQADAHAEVARIEELAARQERVRAALTRDQVEEAVRAELAAAAPPLPALVVRIDPDPDGDEREAPPVPAFDDLRVPAAKVSAFFDALMGPPRT